MEIEYTVKINNRHNPPIFNKELGKGVLMKVIVDFKGATKKDLKSPLFLRQMYEQAEKFRDDWVDVDFKPKNHKQKKNKSKGK